MRVGLLKHGLSRTSEYRAWQTMRLRCTVPSNPAYEDYGGRGIRVCDRWLNSVATFVADMGLKPSSKHELDRRDNNGHYEPDNCRWVLRTVNSRNRRSSKLLTFRGETRTVVEWCEVLNLRYPAILKRLESGQTVEQALSLPVRTKSPKGQRRPLPRCVGCGKETHGERCKSCENKRRWAVKRQAARDEATA